MQHFPPMVKNNKRHFEKYDILIEHIEHITSHHICSRNVPRMVFLNSGNKLRQYFGLPSNGSKYYLVYTFKVVHVLAILDP